MKNNTVITDELKEKLSHLEDVNISEIHEFSKSSTLKESYERPTTQTLEKYVASSKPKNTKKSTRLWFSRFKEFVNIRVVNHFLQKRTAQKLNDKGLDSQAIMNVTLHRFLAD